MKIGKVLIVSGIVVFALVAGLFLFIYIALKIAGRDIPPPDTSDLVALRVVVADTDNAYTYFNAATNALYWPAEICNYRFSGDYFSGKATNEAQVVEVLSRNEETFRLIEKGVSCRVYQEPVLINGMITGFNIGKRINIARALACRVFHAKQAGNMTDAVDACGTLLRFGKMTHQGSESVAEICCGDTVINIGLDQARRLSLSGEIGENELTQIAKQLDDGKPVSEGVARGCKGEYQMITSLYAAEPIFGTPGKIRPYLFSPNRTKQKVAEFCRQGVRNAVRCAADFEKFMILDDLEAKTFGGKWSLILRGNIVGKILLATITIDYKRLCLEKCTVESHLAAARLVVAIRRYELAHDGKMPENLQALVPAYLAAVPDDPFDGKPFRYSPEKKIVYSVGKNLIDDGGSVERVKPSGHYDPKDLVYALDKETDVKVQAATTAAYEKRSP